MRYLDVEYVARDTSCTISNSPRALIFVSFSSPPSRIPMLLAHRGITTHVSWDFSPHPRVNRFDEYLYAKIHGWESHAESVFSSEAIACLRKEIVFRTDLVTFFRSPQRY